MDNKATVDPARLVELAPELRRLTEEAGLECCSLATYVGVHQLEAIERAMQAAQAMDCPRIRVNTPGYDRSRNYNELYAETTAHLREVETLARRYGVEANVETHFGNITASAALIHRLVSQFDPQYIGVIYDPGNMVHEGYECWRLGMELLGPYLHEVHAKNAIWEPMDELPQGMFATGAKPTEKQAADGTVLWQPHFSGMRTGFANWQQIMEDLKAVGYDGWIAFEDFSEDEGDVETKCARNLAYLKNYE
jgi:sugar phosphate isomerase/epimerase